MIDTYFCLNENVQLEPVLNGNWIFGMQFRNHTYLLKYILSGHKYQGSEAWQNAGLNLLKA